ncbi:hypothetical protein K437DRAFT_99700 [Tilletiaria anomala UBC 951]|uniref:Uncharacterized protein n=1 Tax=Tilletiaria anomala (strain ATCC 24038 / CBS 436.72 / UBC 951) TaxID=1037660 RepID=A0A066W9C8_TILAU|nr:uncharacterized protein K437DRAFT_99700 [Tilletiaria anomala UBC 951]KDN47340.1 hypothetical protein K437DRAFT_99700 [Tilletiaria anomala UBC 951]
MHTAHDQNDMSICAYGCRARHPARLGRCRNLDAVSRNHQEAAVFDALRVALSSTVNLGAGEHLHTWDATGGSLCRHRIKGLQWKKRRQARRHLARSAIILLTAQLLRIG